MTTFTSEDRLVAQKLVEEAPYHPGYEDAAMGPSTARTPLTEEQITAIEEMVDVSAETSYERWSVLFTRAIEAAHKI